MAMPPVTVGQLDQVSPASGHLQSAGYLPEPDTVACPDSFHHRRAPLSTRVMSDSYPARLPTALNRSPQPGTAAHRKSDDLTCLGSSLVLLLVNSENGDYSPGRLVDLPSAHTLRAKESSELVSG